MPIDRDSFFAFKAADIATAREMAEAFSQDINLPIVDDSLGDPPLLDFCGSLTSAPDNIGLNEEKLRLLLRLGADPNVVGRHGTSPLRSALRNGRSEFIRILLEAGADPNLCDQQGETAVLLAVKHRRLDDLRALLARGADLNHRDKYGHTALTQEILSESPSLEVLKQLIELGADVNASQNLHASLGRSRALHVVTTLIEGGADVNAVDSGGVGPLAVAVSQPQCPTATIEELVRAGARIDSVDAKGLTPLLHASKSGQIEAVKFLLAHGASVAHRDAEGRSALHWCCDNGHEALVPLLVTAGADVNLPTKADPKASGGGSRTPLMYAIQKEAVTRALLKCAPHINAVDAKNCSALMYAIDGYQSSKAKIVELLLRKGADVRLSNSDGNTALHRAVKAYQASDLVPILQAAKADVNATNHAGETPLMLCRDVETMELLVGAGVDVADQVGKTALIHTVNGYRSGVLPKTKFLLRIKANPNIQDNEGTTALMIASRTDDLLKTVRLLVEGGANLDLLDKDGRSATAHASPENLKFLIASGAKLNPFEESRLKNAIDDDNLPLAEMLLDRGVQLKLGLSLFSDRKKTFEKLARANADLLLARVVCTDPEAKEQLDAVLARYARNDAVADDAELPAVLRKGAWPVKVLKRSPSSVAPGRLREIAQSIEYYRGAIHWPADMRRSILNEYRSYGAEKKAASKRGQPPPYREYLTGLLKKKGRISFASLFDNWTLGSESEFIKFWNDNAAAIVWEKYRDRSIDADDITYLLARFELEVLPGVLIAQGKSSKFADALRLVEAPACASVMAGWMAGGPAARIARQWALRFPQACAEGLVVDAVSKLGKDRSAAEACLRFLAFNGHRQTVESVAERFGADVVESVAETLSQDHRADFMPAKPPEMPKFWSADVYPPPRLKAIDKVLPSHAIDALAGMMSLSNSEVRSPALDQVLSACDSKSLANFAWGAFEEWAAKGKKDSEWIFDALTYLGDEACARKLTPYIRNWPRENGIARAYKGLEILAAMGTDVALSQIQAIAQKNKYQTILEGAQAMMKRIAIARDLTPQQLEDRLVPDFGLSAAGDIKLDFGSRYFVGSVDVQLKPVIKDASGTVLKALPAPTKDDDKVLAKESIATWSDLCSEVKPVAKLQLQRLELAMVNSRRWTGGEFKALLVASPLLRQLVKGLVWGTFASKAKLSTSFIVGTGDEFVDADGKAVRMSDGSSIGIVHPLLLDEKTLTAWQKLFAKNKQAQPFAQLVRKTYRAADDTDKSRFGLEGATVASKALKGLLAMGWNTEIGDAGWIWSFRRDFPSGTASLGAEPGVHITDYEYNAKEQKLDVSIPDSLNPMEFSELIRELLTLKK